MSLIDSLLVARVVLHTCGLPVPTPNPTGAMGTGEWEKPTQASVWRGWGCHGCQEARERMLNGAERAGLGGVCLDEAGWVQGQAAPGRSRDLGTLDQPPESGSRERWVLQTSRPWVSLKTWCLTWQERDRRMPRMHSLLSLQKSL